MRRADDRGSGTVLAVFLAVVLICAGAVASTLVSVYAGHQRASVAADLAALAAARHGCDMGERIARAYSAVSFACRLEGGDAVVTVALAPPAMLTRVSAWAGREAPVIAGTSRAGTSG
jgi:secretion/DNA translocation related TadE-like protein